MKYDAKRPILYYISIDCRNRTFEAYRHHRFSAQDPNPFHRRNDPMDEAAAVMGTALSYTLFGIGFVFLILQG